ncbi:MAG: hypothetical protein AAFQ07_09255 [Chloroflexota bacterium]
MPKYDDKFRASAVVMLEATGYPDKEGGLSQVSRNLGVPRTTLRRWFLKKSNPPPSEIVHEKRSDFATAIRKELYGIIEDLPIARSEASYKDMTTAFGILIDKLQLLENKPTSINEQRHNLPPIAEDLLDSILDDDSTD